MRVVAKLNNLRIAPRKARLVTHSIVGLSAAAALVQLRRQVKRSSLPVTVLLKSAIANAKNNFKLAEETLYVKEVRVLDGVRLKRFTPKAFGQATPILRQTSKIHIILDERTPRIPVKPQSENKTKKTVLKKVAAKKLESQEA
jgi:large subunit ribosomal protein L22